jgi:hypothetical protein
MKMGRREPSVTDEIREREREKFEEHATVQGFKYPWTHAWPDIVRADRTLSDSAGLCPVRSFYPGRITDLRFFRNFEVDGLQCH